MWKALAAVGGFLWRWEVVSTGAVAVFFAGGISAIYGDDFTVATSLCFLAIVWITAKTVSWKEVTDDPHRVWVSLFIVVLAVVSLALSWKWIEARESHERAARTPAVPPSSVGLTAKPPSNSPAQPESQVPLSKLKSVPSTTPRSSRITQGGNGNQQTVTQSPITQANNGGCNQQVIGGNNNTNNCVPPERKLTDEMRSKLVNGVCKLPHYDNKLLSSMYAMTDVESAKYTSQILGALSNCNLLPSHRLAQVDSMDVGTGLSIRYRLGDDTTVRFANELADNLGTKAYEDNSLIRLGEVRILVGLSEKK